MTGPVLRGLAVAVILAAIADPAISVRRTQPLPVEISALASTFDRDGAAAVRVREELVTRLGDAIEVTTFKPAAVVLVGGTQPAAGLPDGVPISTVAIEPRGPYVRIRSARALEAVKPGQRAAILVELEGREAAGRTSTVILERDGIEVSRAIHAWASPAGRATVTLTYAPTSAGLIPLRARLLPDGDGSHQDGDVAGVAVAVPGRALRVLAWERRPSWSLAFVRRALEADVSFDVSSFVRSSRGLATRAGAPPETISASGLAPFDVVLAGAPEELTQGEVEALDAFMRVRGGAVVFLPDRIPEGPYRQLLPAGAFDEVLVERPLAVDAGEGSRFVASEFALPGRDGGGAAIASLERGGARQAVVASWPRGEGIVVFSGALDAWRYRGTTADVGAFGRFWVGAVASLALASPPALSVTVEPALAAPGDPVIVRARYRGTEWTAGGDQVSLPAVSAALVASTGGESPLRLWPADALGEDEATIAAPPPGRYDVRITARTAAAADTTLLGCAGRAHAHIRARSRRSCRR